MPSYYIYVSRINCWITLCGCKELRDTKPVMLDCCWLLIMPPYLLYTDCRHILYTYYTTCWRLDERHQIWAAGLLDFALVMGKSLWKKGIYDLMKNWTFNEMKADFSMDIMIPREQVLAFYWLLLFACHLPLICYICN